MKPVGFCVLVRPDSATNDLKNEMIAIPDSVLDRQRIEVTTGTLIATGQLAWKGVQGGNDEPWANVGDHVVYAKYGGKLITDPETGEKVILLLDKDIIGVI